MDSDEKGFRKTLKYGNDALFWIELANRSFFDLKRTLIGLATLLLPLTASVTVINQKFFN